MNVGHGDKGKMLVPIFYAFGDTGPNYLQNSAVEKFNLAVTERMVKRPPCLSNFQEFTEGLEQGTLKMSALVTMYL